MHTGLNPLEGLTIRKSGAYSVSLFQWIVVMVSNQGRQPRKTVRALPRQAHVSEKTHDGSILAEFRLQDMQITYTAA